MSQDATWPHEHGRKFSYPDPATSAYSANPPFPHLVIEGAWDSALLAECKREIGQFSAWDGEKDFYGARKKRFCGDLEALPTSVAQVIREASSPAFLRWLEQLTGESGLLPDPYLEGGGIHQIVPGGFLKVHADFNWNDQLKLYRRLNVLIYLNPSWRQEWGGGLELWTTDMAACAKLVLPEANTMVVFTTDDRSFHGHPQPLACPAGVSRDSVALYYYSSIEPAAHHAQKRLKTDYRPIKGDHFSARGTSLRAKVKTTLRRWLREMPP